MGIEFTKKLANKLSERLDIVKDGETYLVASRDVLEFGRVAMQEGASILGFEGFIYNEHELIPQMDAIASFEPGATSFNYFKKVADLMVEESKANYYEFVFDLD